MWSFHTLEYYLAMKRSEVLTLTTTWKNLEHMMLSERHQTRKDKHCVISLTGGPWRTQIHRNRKEMGEARGWGRGRECLIGTKCQFGKVRKFWRQTVGMSAQQCECI